MVIETLLSAGVTGLVGNAISTIFSFVNQKQKNKHDFNMRKLDIEAMTKEAEMNIKITETKVQGDLALAEMESFNESVKQNAIDKLSGNILEKLFERGWTTPFGVLIAVLFGLIDFIKGLIRPGLTLYMTVVVTMVYFKVMAVIEESHDAFTYESSIKIFDEITGTILYLTVSMTLWWFGERRIAKTMNRQNNWKK